MPPSEQTGGDGAVADPTPTVSEQEELDPGQLRLEELYLGLRTSGGVSLQLLPEGTSQAWTANGWAEVTDGWLRLTVEGWLRLDALVRSIA